MAWGGLRPLMADCRAGALWITSLVLLFDIFISAGAKKISSSRHDFQRKGSFDANNLCKLVVMCHLSWVVVLAGDSSGGSCSEGFSKTIRPDNGPYTKFIILLYHWSHKMVSRWQIPDPKSRSPESVASSGGVRTLELTCGLSQMYKLTLGV